MFLCIEEFKFMPLRPFPLIVVPAFVSNSAWAQARRPNKVDDVALRDVAQGKGEGRGGTDETDPGRRGLLTKTTLWTVTVRGPRPNLVTLPKM
jgi:hypothetical protein